VRFLKKLSEGPTRKGSEGPGGVKKMRERANRIPVSLKIKLLISKADPLTIQPRPGANCRLKFTTLKQRLDPSQHLKEQDEQFLSSDYLMYTANVLVNNVPLKGQ
jgi:hypothetical protein